MINAVNKLQELLEAVMQRNQLAEVLGCLHSDKRIEDAYKNLVCLGLAEEIAGTLPTYYRLTDAFHDSKEASRKIEAMFYGKDEMK